MNYFDDISLPVCPGEKMIHINFEACEILHKKESD